MSSAGAATAAAAAAAAAAKRLQDEEEERLTKYSETDLAEGWEFKIVRSNTALKGERFANLCREEAQTGWELVEVFDKNRIRFKRLIANRANDHLTAGDPYRTRIGLSEGALVAIIFGAILLVPLAIYLSIRFLNL